MTPLPMRIAAAWFALAAAVVVAVWAWLGAGVDVAVAPAGAEGKVPCISYAPFRSDETPFGPDTPIDARQIEEDLTQLKPLTDCIRTYSVDHGLDQIPAIAQRHGMKVMLGLWLSSLPDLSQQQIETAVALANRFPDTVQSVVVGNEVLLRGEMSAPALVDTIRAVKSRVPMPVTYADVWEFWLRYREVASAVDFITIHVLPYWEDFPIPARDAVPHLRAIRARVGAAFPGRDIMVGEFGWPSAGRMREGALPSPSNQARAIQEVLADARAGGYRVNLIEAYDQPWKRLLEGTVGGHWGLFDAYHRRAKFVFGQAVSDHPAWRWQAAGGLALVAITFAVALVARRRNAGPAPVALWPAIGAIAVVSGSLIGWTVANVPVESLGPGDWLRSLAWTVVAALAPLSVAAALASATPMPSFARLLAHRGKHLLDPLAWILGGLLMALAILAVQAALGLAFDPRYRDFPFTALTGAVAPFLILSLMSKRGLGGRAVAEAVMAATLALSAAYIALNEGFANWQALWFCGAAAALALTLARVRDAPG